MAPKTMLVVPPPARLCPSEIRERKLGRGRREIYMMELRCEVISAMLTPLALSFSMR